MFSPGEGRFGLTMAFALLVLAQAAHSVEEHAGRLWESFPPARAVVGLVSQDPRLGFLAVNLVLVAFGLWCLLWPVSRGWRSAVPLAWSWVALELVNGIVHCVWSLARGGYTPGVATAPLLVVAALCTASRLRSLAASPGR